MSAGAGTGKAAAGAASAPYVRRRPLGRCTTSPLRAWHSDGLTFHWLAAACTSITRAVAPAWRIGSQAARMDVEPPVIWRPSSGLPYSLSSAPACLTRTWPSPTSSSSATSIGIEV